MEFLREMLFDKNQKRRFIKSMLNNKKFNDKNKSLIIDLYLSGDLDLYFPIFSIGLSLKSVSLQNKNIKFLTRFSHRKTNGLKNFLNLNPYLGKEISDIPLLKTEFEVDLFKKFIKKKKISLKINLNNTDTLLHVLNSHPKALKFYKLDSTEIFEKSLEKLKGKSMYEINKITLSHILKKIDKNQVIAKRPMLEYFLKEDISPENFIYFVDIEHYTNLTISNLTDYLKEIFGIKSANMVNLFLKNKEKHKLILIGKIVKTTFVEKNKINYALEFLNKKYSNKQYYTLSYAKVGLNRISNVLTTEQFKIILNNFLINQNLESVFDICKFLDGLSKNNFRIDTKFSNINTIEKLEKYLHLKSLKSFKSDIELISPIKINESLILKNKIQLVLPKTSHQLIDWGWELENCLGTEDFEELINDKELILVGVLKEGKLTYCLEIDGGYLDEELSLGKRNSEINPVDFKIIKKYLEPILKKHRSNLKI